MGKRGTTSSGANLEPMPFTRKFGNGDGGDQGDNVSFGSQDGGFGSSEKKRMSRRRDYTPESSSRSRSRSPHAKKKKKHSRESRKHRSRSRDRSMERDRSRSKHRESRESRQPRPPIPSNAILPTPLFQVAVQLPPQVRGQVVAQSLLVKPEALPSVISDAAQTAGIEGTEREGRKKSRWSSTKSFVPGMPTILPSNLSDDQRQGYLLQIEIEDATRKLRLGDFLPPEGAPRSPSPEPVYDSNGKRLNTREVRKKQELEQLRHEKIQALLKINPAYKPPADYRAPNIRLHEKVWIPQEAHPEINFVGLLIGPRGNTLKALEQETQAKIIIRGKGSVKEGKLGRRDGPLPGENEPLHAYITGPDKAIIKRAVERINEIINAALMIPEGHNELRKLQLRELAVLNGTLRPEDILNSARCSNCGSDQHKSWECPDAPNVTANIICTVCGGAGHIARDCKSLRSGEGMPMQTFDDEYSAFMEVLGEQPGQGMPFGQPVSGQAYFAKPREPIDISKIPPLSQCIIPSPPHSPYPPPPDFNYFMEWFNANRERIASGSFDQFLAPPPPPPSSELKTPKSEAGSEMRIKQEDEYLNYKGFN